MKRIMLLLFAVLLIPIYSHAISIDELTTAMEETPERFLAQKISDFFRIDDTFSVKRHYMSYKSGTLVWSSTSYGIFDFAPNYIYEVRMQYVVQGAPNSTLADLAKNGVIVSREVLSVHAYAFDGTFLPKESQKMLPIFQSSVKRKNNKKENFLLLSNPK
ncbi:MAG: hypothetical protein E6102_00695 [Negativicoccus succinicivorans]|uniref:hypothetical protein n=1 Tax=Negativicoccus succinicivorans TaxID=620903 RepID=UPI0029113C9A|nr:hypothetical protein [Negativicoccus succinicivorans]MDU5395269.1 hypothetical protein [Negativicoccus succinicivorans]